MTLPKYVNKHISRHGKTMYYFRKDRRERVRLPDDLTSPAFEEAYNKALVDHTPVNPYTQMTPAKARKHFHQRRLVEITLCKSLTGARARAAKKGIGFDLDIDWLLQRAEANSFCCELTGIPFFSGQFGIPVHRAFSPSIDRIDNSLGYLKSNVRIVLLAVNVMLSDWGQPIFEAIARSYALAHAPQMIGKHPKKGGALPTPKYDRPPLAKKEPQNQ